MSKVGRSAGNLIGLFGGVIVFAASSNTRCSYSSQYLIHMGFCEGMVTFLGSLVSLVSHTGEDAVDDGAPSERYSYHSNDLLITLKLLDPPLGLNTLTGISTGV
jgi:hypothetical protein